MRWAAVVLLAWWRRAASSSLDEVQSMLGAVAGIDVLRHQPALRGPLRPRTLACSRQLRYRQSTDPGQGLLRPRARTAGHDLRGRI